MATAKKDRSQELQGMKARAKLARERCGYGVRETEDLLGLSAGAVTRLEDGTRIPELDSLIALARLYRVPLGWLIAEEVPLPPLDEPPERAPLGDRRRASVG